MVLPQFFTLSDSFDPCFLEADRAEMAFSYYLFDHDQEVNLINVFTAATEGIKNPPSIYLHVCILAKHSYIENVLCKRQN